MTTLSSYDLAEALTRKFAVSMESENEIEISADEVIINQAQTTDSEIEELAEETTVVNEASDNLDDIDNTSEALESLIYSMESSILTGGYDVRNAQIANIALESIASQYKIDSTYLTFGLEEVSEDGEAETKSAIGKAKQMLGALKNNTSALLNKMYTSAMAALGSTSALSEKLIVKAGQLKNNVNTDNGGDNNVKLPKSVKRKLTVDGTTVLSPDKYLQELKRLTAKYNSVVKVYADTDVLAKFSQDVVAGMNNGSIQTGSKKAIITAVREISSDINKKVDSKKDTEELTSDPYLGGATIHAKKPTVAAVQKALTTQSDDKTVSQEGVGAFVASSLKMNIGATMAIYGTAGLSVATAMFGMVVFKGATNAALAAAGINLTVAALPLTITAVVIAVVSTYGFKKGMDMLTGNWQSYKDEINKAIAKFTSMFKKNTEEASEAATEFSLVNTGASMEADEAATEVSSLSANQVKTVADIILGTSTTTKTMKAQLNKRKAIVKDIDAITKNLSKADEANVQASKAASTFIRRYIKETIKFEMQLTNYTVSIMKAALAYAEASNGAKVAESETADDEKKIAE